MKIGVLYSRIRRDEKLLLEELRSRGHTEIKIDTRSLKLELEQNDELGDLDIIVNRDISQSRGLYATRILESHGHRVVNTYETSRICSDKIETSLALTENNVETPTTKVAFNQESALEAIEDIGYPVVLKPVVGSWARLLSKVNDRDAAESLLEHKEVLGNYMHSVHYIQDYVEKPGRDIRVMVAGDSVPAAMYRSSEDWITNAARGGETTRCEVTDEIHETALGAADAVGGGVVGVDIMETPSGELSVHEVNHTLEFKALTEASGVDVAARYVDYLETAVDGGAS